MSDSGVEKLFPAGARIERIFTAPELDSGAVLPSGWDAEGMRLCKQRSYGRAVRGNGVFLKEYVYTSWFRRLRRTFSTPRPFIALAAIGAAAMMLDYLGEREAAAAIEKAIATATGTKMKSMAAGKMGFSTSEVGDLIVSLL